MTAERWRRIEELFDGALGLSSGQRAGFLEAECAGDHDLRREVEAMLLHDGAGEIIHEIVARVATEISVTRDNWAGRRLGAYRFLRSIGQGGMGAVFLAARDDDQFRKEVAIKTLRFEVSDSLTMARFRHERQVLAGLEHTHIARLLDGGATEHGLPYLVMEYVAGVPITDYCVGKELPIEARLRLFQRVCDAVQYAHQNLVVHRDLKPANILVTGTGVAKLVDFGIAKLLEPEAGGDAAMHTVTGALLMTPEYASPEQVRGEAVSTSTDIYSLGAVLYEMLTGARAHVLTTGDPAEVVRVVCETEVRPPSADGGRRLRGDLDNIVLKAMQKDPARRYRSASQFSDDIDRYLAGLPVSARPDSVAYRMRKYMRRNWLGVSAGAAVILALAAGAGVALREARIAREQFNDVRALANRFLFDFHDAIAPVEGTTKARELIVSTALDYLNKLGRRAGNDPSLERELAAAYWKVGRVQGLPGGANLGRTADARKSLEKAVALYDRAGARTVEEIAREVDPMRDLAVLESDQRRFDESLAWSRRALALAQRVPKERMTPTLATRMALIASRMSEALEGKGDSEAAYRAVLAAERMLDDYGVRDRSGQFDRRPVGLLDNLETTARLSGRLEEALRVAGELLRKRGATPDAVGFYNSRVSELYASIDEPSWDDPARALPLVLGAVSEAQRGLRVDPNDSNIRYSLAVNNSKIGYYLRETDPPRAVAALEYTIRLFESMVRDDPGNVEYPVRLALYRARMALARSYLHQRAAVEALTSQVLTDASVTLGQDRLHAMNLCAAALAKVGSHTLAGRIFDEATDLAGELLAREGGRTSTQIEATRSLEQQAEFLRRSGDTARAARLLEQAAAVWQSREPATTYVKLRRARSERLLAALRTGRLPR